MSLWLFLMCLMAAGVWLVYDGLVLFRWRYRGGYTWLGSNYKRVIRIILGVLVLYMAYIFARHMIGG